MTDQTPQTDEGRVLDNVTGNKWTDRIRAIETQARAEGIDFAEGYAEEAAAQARAEALDRQALIDALNRVAMGSRDNGIESFDTAPVADLADAILSELSR